MGERMDGARGGTSADTWVPLLAEQSSLDDVFLPLKSTTRIKYTSFDISERYLVVGASSGSLFVFQREPLKFLQVLPSKLGAAIQVCLAPDDNLIGYGTDKGLVAIIEHNIARKGNYSPQRLHLSYDHRGMQILALCWNTNSSRLFAGDDKGRVSVVNLATSKAKLLLQVPSVIIMRLDSKIVQLDYAQDKLVASTMTKSYLCNTTAEQFAQIGKKTREGEFGACFFNCNRVQTPSIYATRPGYRIWEIDYQGIVLNTHELKDVLTIPPHSITFLDSTTLPITSNSTHSSQNSNFGIVMTLGTKFLITWTEDALYIFDPINVEFILWSESIKGIRYLRCFKNDIYLWLKNGTFKHIALLPVEKLIHQLFHRQNFVLCAEAICRYESVILAAYSRRYVSISMMKELVAQLNENEKCNLASQIEIISNQVEVESESMSSSLSGRSSADSFSKQESGIYIVHPSSGYTSDSDDFRRISRRHTYKSQLASSRTTSPFQPISPQRLHSTTRSPILKPKVSTSVTSAQISNGIEIDGIISEHSKPGIKSSKTSVSQSAKYEKKNITRSSPLSSSQANTLPSSRKASDVKLPPLSRKTSKMSQSYPAPSSQPLLSASRRSPSTLTKKQVQSSKPGSPSSSQKINRLERKSPSLSSGDIGKESRAENLRSSKERLPSPREKMLPTKERTSSPKERVPSPKERMASPKERMASPKERTTSPKEKMASPKERTMSPKDRTASPKERTSSPKDRVSSPKEKYHPDDKLKEKQIAHVKDSQVSPRCQIDKEKGKRKSEGNTNLKSSIQIPEKMTAKDITTSTPKDNLLISTSIVKSKELIKVKAKDESKTKEKEAGKITLAFPYSTYLPYGLVEPTFGDFGENCAIVTIPTPASLSEIRDTISSTFNTGKDIVRQTIEGIEERLHFSKVDNTFDLLDVNCKVNQVKHSSLLIPEEPIVSNYKNEKLSLEKETFPLTMAFRKNLFSLSTSDITDFVNLSKDTLNKISATPNDSEHNLPSRKTLSEWLSALDELQSKVMKGVKIQISNEIEDLKLNITSLGKLMQRSSDFHNQIKNRFFSTTKNGNDSLPSNSIENISDFIVNNMIFVEDPFDIMKEDQNIIRNLIMLCLKWKIFSAVKLNEPENSIQHNGDLSSTFVPPAVFTDTVDKMISCDTEEFKKNQSMSHLKKSISFTHGFVSHLTEEKYKQWLESVKMLSCINYSEASSSLDQEAAAFVRKYFHLMDLEEAHQMVLGWTNCCRCFSWLALVEGYAESKWDDALYRSVLEGKKLTEFKHSSSLNLLAVAKKLMETNPSIGIDICIHNNSLITPVDILFLCCLTSHPAHWFELYLNRMITSGTKGNIQPIFHMRTALNQLAVDDEVIMNWAAIILAKSDSMRESLKCSCGYPRLWAHQISWPQSPLLWQLLKKKTPWHDHLALWCYLCGFWPGFLLHCKEENWHDLAMELIIQLGDIKLISSTLEYGFYPLNEDVWTQLLSTIARQQHCPELISCLRCGLTLCKRSVVTSPCDQFVSNASQSSVMTRSSEAAKLVMAFDDQPESLNKPPSILWTNVTQLLLQQFPPSDAIALLKTVEDSMPPGSLPPESLKRLILTSIMKTQNRSSFFSKLPNDDNLSRYHERPKFLGPELYHLFQAEKRNLGSDSLMPVNELPSLPSPRFQEQSNCHWGIVLSLHDDCSICRLPLSLGTSNIIQGIVILNCGHAFHQGCLEKRSCCICDSTNK